MIEGEVKMQTIIEPAKKPNPDATTPAATPVAPAAPAKPAVAPQTPNATPSVQPSKATPAQAKPQDKKTDRDQKTNDILAKIKSRFVADENAKSPLPGYIEEGWREASTMPVDVYAFLSKRISSLRNTFFLTAILLILFTAFGLLFSSALVLLDYFMIPAILAVITSIVLGVFTYLYNLKYRNIFKRKFVWKYGRVTSKGDPNGQKKSIFPFYMIDGKVACKALDSVVVNDRAFAVRVEAPKPDFFRNDFCFKLYR